jgi:hypothetical protein
MDGLTALISLQSMYCPGGGCTTTPLAPWNCSQVVTDQLTAMPIMGSYDSVILQSHNCTHEQVLMMRDDETVWYYDFFPLNCSVIPPRPTANHTYSLYLGSLESPMTLKLLPSGTYYNETHLIFDGPCPQDCQLPPVGDTADAICTSFSDSVAGRPMCIYALPSWTFVAQVNATHVELAQVLPPDPCAPWTAPNRTGIFPFGNPLVTAALPMTDSPTVFSPTVSPVERAPVGVFGPGQSTAAVASGITVACVVVVVLIGLAARAVT